MPWIQSHDTLGSHPKTRRAARLAGCSVPTMVGHLHLLWHWAVGVSLDGDLSGFARGDIARAAMWNGDPEVFLAALIDCGPGEAEGFLTADLHLHDWMEYGGKVAVQIDRTRRIRGERALVTPSMRARVIRRFGCCQACGSSELLEVDHYLPIALGGTSDEDNLWVLCRRCNRSKGKKHPDDWRAR